MKYILAILFCILPLTASAHTFRIVKFSGTGSTPLILKFENCTKVLSIDQFGNALIELQCPSPPIGNAAQDLSPPNQASPQNWSYEVHFPSPFSNSKGANGAVLMDENCRPFYYSDELNASAVDCRHLESGT